MKNISHIKDCYGCGVCATICPKKIITISLNEEGFYVPYISNIGECINCGLCLDVCAYSHDSLSLQNYDIHSFAAWSKDAQIRNKCSSGGVGYELGKSLLERGYKVCGVKYHTANQRAEHYIASTNEELLESVGSKYIQSYTLDAFQSIKLKEKYLVTGTPCQIDSFRRYIRKKRVEDNFVLMDFFCHGVPSMLVWKKYIKAVEAITGPILYASWRNKVTGWHDSWAMAIEGEHRKDYYSRLSQGDLFYALFLGNMCLGKSCYKSCKYKYNRSAADIRIGDLWGETYQKDEKGVSAAISFTSKGYEALSHCNCTLVTHPFEIVAEGQCKKSFKSPRVRKHIIKRLQSEDSLESILSFFKWYTLPDRILALPQRIINKIKRILK